MLAEATMLTEVTTMVLQVGVTKATPNSNYTNFFLINLVNDICVHPNQGELISCDQAGSIKQWDLTENICTLELVS
jgi:hypothetical protein